MEKKGGWPLNSFRIAGRIMMILFLSMWHPLPARSYGVLAHEAIVDAMWDKSIRPLLKEKYPKATQAELLKARAYAYGGAIIPDMGYYPMGRPLFSRLVHYVRSGDFVLAALEEARNLNEYAFAIGILSHYQADHYGHKLGINPSVALMFPHLEKKYGESVNYEQSCNAHSKLEFGCDVIQTARGNYASEAYHDFIGFEVSDSLLERAFYKTYKIDIHDIFRSLSVAISVFRFSVKVIIPELTKDAWKVKNSIITKINPLADRNKYIYKYDRKNYRKEFTQPKVQSVLITIVIGVLPKVSVFSRFKPKYPDERSEKLFEESFEAIQPHYGAQLKQLHARKIECVNINLDTGNETAFGEYKLADKSYYKLLKKLTKRKFEGVDESLKKDLLSFYSNRSASELYGPETHKGKKITRALEQLNAVPVNGLESKKP